jgi:hypothetical protein
LCNATSRVVEVCPGLPWELTRVSPDRTVVPQTTSWLPEEEAVQLHFEVDTEFAHLESALGFAQAATSVTGSTAFPRVTQGNASPYRHLRTPI